MGSLKKRVKRKMSPLYTLRKIYKKEFVGESTWACRRVGVNGCGRVGGFVEEGGWWERIEGCGPGRGGKGRHGVYGQRWQLEPANGKRG